MSTPIVAPGSTPVNATPLDSLDEMILATLRTHSAEVWGYEGSNVDHAARTFAASHRQMLRAVAEAAQIAGLTRSTATVVGDDPHRAAVVAGLRDLADWLAVTPAAPVDEFDRGTLQHSPLSGGREGARQTVREVAAAIGAEVDEHRGSVTTERSFGPIAYVVYAS